MAIPFFDGNNALQLEIVGTGEQMTIEEANEKLKSYCSTSSFSDNTWIIDKVFTDKNIQQHRKSIYFSQIENPYLRHEVKMWIIYRMMKRRSVSTLIDDVTHVSKLANCINSKTKTFKDVKPVEVLSFYQLLFENSPEISLRGQLRDWYGARTFATEMKFNALKNCMNKYVVESYPQGGRYDDKYIPEEVAVKLDIFMKQESVPLVFRCIYWSLRLIPNRVTEVLSLTVNCLKQIDKDTYVLTIPTFKQAGSYYKGSIKMIELKDEGIGSYYINLLKQQIEYTKNIEADDDFLFYAKKYRNKINGNEIKYFNCKGPDIKISYSHTRTFFKTVCDVKKYVDEKGNPISIATHQFRHNAITDRLTSGIFRPIEVMGLTAHHNTQMIENSYTHRTAKDLTIGEKPIVFNGRIINTDNDMQENSILRRPFAKRIYKLGVCSDIRDCNCDKSKCLRCEYLIPNADDLDYYQNEMNDWKTKMEKANSIGNTDFAELCEYWIESYEILIERIIKTLSNENVDFNESEVNNHGE